MSLTTKQRKARARAERKKRQRIERAQRNIRTRRAQRDMALGIKTIPKTVMQSLDDLLPAGATYQVDPDGKITISMNTKRGNEDECAADIARRLNIDPAELEVNTKAERASTREVIGPEDNRPLGSGSA